MPVAQFFVITTVTAAVSTVYALYTVRQRRRNSGECVKRINAYTNTK